MNREISPIDDQILSELHHMARRHIGVENAERLSGLFAVAISAIRLAAIEWRRAGNGSADDLQRRLSAAVDPHIRQIVNLLAVEAVGR